MTADKPRAVGYCDEHRRYFYWDAGCAPGRPSPAWTEIRAWYDQIHRSGSVTAKNAAQDPSDEKAAVPS